MAKLPLRAEFDPRATGDTYANDTRAESSSDVDAPHGHDGLCGESN
jgi:hypothetical protein